MKAIKTTGAAVLVTLAIALTSCSTEDSIHSSVTNYAVLSLNDETDEPILIEQGTNYTDPGAMATIDDQEVPITTTYTGRYRGNTFNETLDTDVSDFYTTSYSAVNEEGFSSSVTRDIIVAETGDLVNSIAGLYRSTVFRNGVQGTPESAYTDIEYILIWENEDGTYGISDAFGGWYLFGRAIAGSETPGGIIVANNITSDDFEFPATLSNAYFGGSAEITGLNVNPDDNSIDMITVWEADAETTYTFNIHLEQVQF